MERIAIYGKGGVGKSVIATSLSACFARMGKRVFHIGCDPKQDSSIRLVGIDSPVTTVLDALGKRGRARGRLEVINHGRLGIECCESGGPEPGVGCAGRGVARTLELLEEEDLFAKGGYDVVIYDVLGDVVCGGFAAPMREGFAEKIVIVTSEETMSLFAANNICRAVRTHAENGIVLAGLVGNLREKGADPAPVNLFASIVNTEVLAFVPRDRKIAEAEKRAMTVVEHAPESVSAPVLEALARKLLDLEPRELELPEPLSNQEFFRFSRDL